VRDLRAAGNSSATQRTSSRFSATWVCMYSPGAASIRRPAIASWASLLVGAKRTVTA
jgi:hypothetical protein